jgi:hypothetical protein
MTIIINDFGGILQCKLPLLDETLGRIYAHRDLFSVITGLLSETFNILEITNCVRKELQ